MGFSKKRLLTAVLASVLITGVVTACSSGKSGSSTGSSTSASTGASTSGSSGSASSGQAAAAAFYAANQRTDVKLPFPTTPVAVGHHRVAEINAGLNSPYGVTISKYANAALKATGWQYSEFDGANSIPKIGGYMAQALQQKFDAVILEAVDMGLVTAPAQALIDAKIPIICISCQSMGAFAGKVIDISGDWETQGEATAAAIVATKGTKAKVVRFNEPNYISVVGVTKGGKAGMAKFCPTCSISTIDFSVTDLGKPGPPVWSAFLSSHPAGSFTDVSAPFDFAAQAFQATATQAGRSDVHLSSTASLSAQLEAMKAGKTVGYATVEPTQYQVWAAVDMAARAMAGQPLWTAKDLYSPITSGTAVDKFLPLGDYTPDGLNYPAMFAAQWTK
jgi:ABC-type sugar transport system substrate-binding protein